MDYIVHFKTYIFSSYLLYMKTKFPFILFFFMISFIVASGQGTGISDNAPTVSFYAGIGEGDFGEDPHPVHGVECPDGGFIVGGKSIDSGGAWDGFALKVNPSGLSGYQHLTPPGEEGDSYSWSVTFGSSGKKDGVNNLATVGNAVFLGGFSSVNDGSQDAYLAKHSTATGSKIWESFLSESSNALSSAYEVVFATPEGGLITGGVYDSTQDGLEGFKSYGNPSSGSAFVAYFSPAQITSSVAPTAPVWRKDFSSSLTVKGIRPIGETGEFIVLTSLSEVPHIPCLIRLDASGNILWQKNYPTRGEPTDVCVLAKDGAVMGLAFCGHGKSEGTIDSFLTGLDLDGNVSWTRTFGDPSGGIGKFAGLSSGNPKLIYDESWGVCATADGGMLVASGTGIEGCDPWRGSDSNQTRISILNECVADPRTDWRGMVTKFDASGKQIWQRVDSFMPPDGGNASSSACEYLLLSADGKILSVNDEAFGVGLLVLEPEATISNSEDILLSAAVDLGNRWKNLDWFGSFLPFSSGWKYHTRLGWIFTSSQSLDSIWFYDQSFGWCWTGQTIYPYIWRNSPAGWLYFLKNSTPRSFFEYSQSVWTKL